MDGTTEHPIFYFDADGSGPFFHVCAQNRSTAAARVRDWLDRQRLLGIDAASAAVVEQLIEDLP